MLTAYHNLHLLTGDLTQRKLFILDPAFTSMAAVLTTAASLQTIPAVSSLQPLKVGFI
jgi:hypothetical protein